MWTILKNESWALSRNKALWAVSIGFVLVLCSALYLGAAQMAQERVSFEQAKAHVRGQWEALKEMNPHGAAHFGTFVFKPSNALSSLDEGVHSVLGNVIRVEGHVQNEMVHSEASQMMAASKFGKLKSALLLQYVLPLLLIFLAFHSISSEKQSGRLKLLLLQGASPRALVLAKTLVVWLYGVLLLLLVMLAYTLLNYQELTLEILGRGALFFASYTLYYFVLSGLGVYSSLKWQNATVALTSLLGIWMIWTLFMPSIAMSIVDKLNPLPSRAAFQTAMKTDRAKGIDGHNPSDARGLELKQRVLKQYGVDSIAQLPINFDGLRMQADEEYGNKVWDKHFGNLRKVQARQKRNYQWMGVLNPFLSLQNASMGVVGSDNLHHQEFLLQVEHYRRKLIKALNDEHAYGGSKSGDWGWKASNAFYKSIEDFKYEPTTFSSVWNYYKSDLGFLCFWSIGILVLLLRGAKKMQVI